MRVELDGPWLRLDGERKLIRSVSFDYFRLPSPDAWRDRIEKIGSAGFNAVSIAYPWTYHSEAPGSYDFTGSRDIDLLHDMLEEAGLYLIARPGPWLGEDLDLGGLPAWLLRDPAVRLRCRDAGELHHSVEYMGSVEAWFDQVVPRFARRDNLLLVEVEHQYSVPAPMPWTRTDAAALAARVLGPERLFDWMSWCQGSRFIEPPERDVAMGGQRSGYMRELCEWVRERGVSVPLMHADLSASLRQMDVDLPAIERRPLSPAADARAFAKDLLDFRGDAHASPAGAPLAYTGLDAGHSESWGGAGHAYWRDRESTQPIEARVASALGVGALLFNVRRFCGGVTWGYMGAPDVCSSYDCAAPVAQGGRLGPAYEALRRLNHWLDRFEDELLESKLLEHRTEEHILMTQRAGERHRFCFVHNASDRAGRLAYDGEPRVELAPFETQIRVYDASDRIESVSEPFRSPNPVASPPSAAAQELPRLEEWTFSGTSPQLETAFDDSSWTEIPARQVERGEIDIDRLGIHHGFVWYRGTFSGPLDRLILEARHSYSVWLNRRRIAGADAQRVHPLGLEPAERVSIPVPADACNSGRNALVILVESLGHGENALGADPQSPGIRYVDTGSSAVQWRYRAGLVRGERGLAPMLAFEAVERTSSAPVSLPHAWPAELEGVGLYETRVRLEGLDTKRGPLAVRFDPGRGKANLYVNGYLMGRYWPERGPQQEFAVPWGVLRPDQENHLAVALWKRADRAALGHVRLVLEA